MKKAFTLAEALTTLMIVGIIAAMTIPTLFADVDRRRNMTNLKKTYSSFMVNIQSVLNHIDEGSAVSCSTLSCTRGWGDIDNNDCADKYNDCNNNLANKQYFNIDFSCDNCFSTARKGEGLILPPNWTGDNANFQWGYILRNQVHMALMSYENNCVEEIATVTKNDDEIPLCGMVLFDVNGDRGPNKPGTDLFAFYLADEPIAGSYLIPVGYDNYEIEEDVTVSSALGDDDVAVDYNKTAQVMLNGWKYEE